MLETSLACLPRRSPPLPYFWFSTWVLLWLYSPATIVFAVPFSRACAYCPDALWLAVWIGSPDVWHFDCDSPLIISRCCSIIRVSCGFARFNVLSGLFLVVSVIRKVKVSLLFAPAQGSCAAYLSALSLFRLDYTLVVFSTFYILINSNAINCFYFINGLLNNE